MVVLVAKLCPTPWIVTCHAPLSTGFPRQKYWSGLPFHFPGDLPDPGIKSTTPALVDSLPLSHLGGLGIKIPHTLKVHCVLSSVKNHLGH